MEYVNNRLRETDGVSNRYGSNLADIIGKTLKS